MTTAERTAHLQRQDIAIDLLDANPDNPNEMSDGEFNALVASMESLGWVDAVFVRPYHQIVDNLAVLRYRIIGGHHRVQAGKVLGYEKAPCVIVTDPEFDEDAEKFALVKMNVIRGKMSPKKFLALYQKLTPKYTAEVMKESFGFAQQEQFDALIGACAKTLPSNVQADFKKAAAEIKTIDGLSKLLNKMFTTYGDTLPYGFMILDYGGQDSVWLRMSKTTKKAVLELGKRCVNESRTVDDIVGGLLVMVANGHLEPALLQLIADTKPVVLPTTNTVA